MSRCDALVVLIVLFIATALLSPPLKPLAGSSPLQVPDPPDHLVISRVYYYAYPNWANEFIEIFNPTQNVVNVSFWRIADQEGTLTFPEGAEMGPHSRLIIAENSTALYAASKLIANFSYAGGNATKMEVTGSFKLSNTGDEVLLRDYSDGLVDAFVYGSSTYAGEGWSGPPTATLSKGKIAVRAERENGFLDTDGAGDWDTPRSYGIGQTSMQVSTFAFEGRGEASLSPDNAYSKLTEWIDSARHSISLSLYTITDNNLSIALQSAARRGVSVRLLVEGSPVGGVLTSEVDELWALEHSGVQVRLMMENISSGTYARYKFLHAKYAVIDRELSIVTSENWGQNGFPSNDRWGNRGWSVALWDSSLAAYLSSIFEADWDPFYGDVVNLSVANLTFTNRTAEPVPEGRAPVFSSLSLTGSFRVTPVIAPDTSVDERGVIGLIRSAVSEILVEEFHVKTDWDKYRNLYLEELKDAARRGVRVRVLLDGSWYNIEENDPKDNDDVVGALNQIALAENLDLQAKIANLDAHKFLKVHNKGMIVDREKVLISSINWNYNSVTQNRELGLIVENLELARYFASAFDYDWKDDVTSPVADAGGDRMVAVGELVTFDGSSSWDDVGIENYSWDLNGDGRYDAYGMEVLTSYKEEGDVLVTLRVADAWENNETASVVIHVVRPATSSLDMYWLALALGSIGVVGLASLLILRTIGQRINKKGRM